MWTRIAPILHFRNLVQQPKLAGYLYNTPYRLYSSHVTALQQLFEAAPAPQAAKPDQIAETFETEAASREIYWRSVAQMVASAVQSTQKGAYVGAAQALPQTVLPNGTRTFQQHAFYVDVVLPRGVTLSPAQFKSIEAEVKQLAKQRTSIETAPLANVQELKNRSPANETMEEILCSVADMLKHSNGRDDQEITVCRVGDHSSITQGVTMQYANRNHVKALQLLDVSGVHGVDNTLRLTGIAFPRNALMEAWEQERKELLARDHRVIGKDQKLFMLHEASPGSVFFLPHGTRIVNTVLQYLRDLYRKYHYEEVRTPVIYKTDLWEQSGHLKYYSDDMFFIEKENIKDQLPDPETGHVEASPTYALKPMNCPGHCLYFASESHSYRDLPIRVADFGTLHRNEISGALSGLTRVRQFHQDDAHIFCTHEQMHREIESCINMVHEVYNRFGFSYRMLLSTRPDEYVGDLQAWNRAEDVLRTALRSSFGSSGFGVREGDGAFYGPKIDILVTDALGREHQAATIQLDFQLPERFKLQYVDSTDTAHRPVMIHRAMLGSVERFMALIIEHYNGKWPLWLNPRQAVIIPMTAHHLEQAHHMQDRFRQAGIHTDVLTYRIKDMIGKKIKQARDRGYEFIGVLGDRDLEAGTVTLRRHEEQLGAVDVDRAIGDILAAIKVSEQQHQQQ